MHSLVIVPTYCEADNIEALLRGLRAVVPATDVLVVDDSSPDGTAQIARRVADELGRIYIYGRPGKQGLGSAYVAGLSWALEHGYDAVVSMDADFSHDPAGLPELLEAAERGADLVIGSRYVPGGSISQWSFWRRMLSRGGNLYSAKMLGVRVADLTSGYRVYSRRLLEHLDLGSIKASGYGFQIEMAYRAVLAGLVVEEVPICFVDRRAGSSKMSMRTIVEALALVTWWGLKRKAVRAAATAKQADRDVPVGSGGGTRLRL